MTDEQKKIVEDNHSLIYKFLHKYSLPIDGYYDLAAIGLCNAAINFDCKKSKFSTYAYKCMLNQVLQEMRHNKAKMIIPKDKIIYYDATIKNTKNEAFSIIDVIPSLKNVESEILLQIQLNEYMKTLKGKDRLIAMYLILGYAQSEIAEIVNCTRQKVYIVKSRLIEYLEKE